jgi:APA family basic amino acid/polyamine antiporter
MQNTPEHESLKREIGVFPFTLAIINSIVGTGIFMLPAIVAAELGATALLAYLVCGVLIFLIALCFAEVGSKVTVSGGTYAYIEAAFGPFAGFIANNIFWFGSCVIADAAIVNALADTLKYFFPILGETLYRCLFFFLLIGILALINIRSVKHSIRFIQVTALVKLAPLALLIILGSGHINMDNLTWTTSPTINSIGAASLILMFAFTGIETPVTNSGEIKNSRRTIPLGIFFGITSVLILYIAIQLVTQGVLGNALQSHRDAPLAAVAGIAFGAAGITIMTLGTTVSMLGGFAGDILAIPRVLYAGARNGILPSPLAKVHPRFFTPHVALITYSGLVFLLAITGGFQLLAILSAAATLLIYLGVILATIQLRRKKYASPEKTFRVPGGLIVPLLACGVIIWLLLSLTMPQLLSFLVFLVFICLVYYILQETKKRRKPIPS